MVSVAVLQPRFQIAAAAVVVVEGDGDVRIVNVYTRACHRQPRFIGSIDSVVGLAIPHSGSVVRELFVLFVHFDRKILLPCKVSRNYLSLLAVVRLTSIGHLLLHRYVLRN